MPLWDELGIAPTGDRSAIRRAYAERLKQTRPDDDPQGFARLRAAYEQAMAQAEAVISVERVLAREEPPVPTEETSPREAPEAEADPKPIQQDAGEIAAIRAIVEAIDRGDVAAAAEALVAGREAGRFSLEDDMSLANQLLLQLATNRNLAGPAIIDAAVRLGWYGAAVPAFQSPLLARLHARVNAERWLVSLREAGTSWHYFLGGQKAAAARLLLGRGRAILSWILPPEPPLLPILAQYRLHAPWIAHHLDARRIASAERMAASRYVRHAAGVWTLAALLPVFIVIAAKTHLGALGAIFVGLVWTFLRGHARSVLLGAAVVTIAGIVAVNLTQKQRAAVATPPIPSGPFAELTRLAEAGNAAAAHQLGERYLNGTGVVSDIGAAIHFLSLARPSVPAAANLLGNIYYNGGAVLQDREAARNFYLDGATRGDPSAQANLAMMLNAGQGGPVDTQEAFKWYLRSARQGTPAALNGVGYSYLIGRGTSRETERGVLWLRAAADAGQPNAMQTLGDLYHRGDGVQPSPMLAYYWLSLALRNYSKNDPMLASARQALARVGQELDDQTKSMADEDVAAWKSQPGRPPY
jgi:TPR repeat protein